MAKERKTTLEILEFIVDCIPVSSPSSDLLQQYKRFIRRRYWKRPG